MIAAIYNLVLLGTTAWIVFGLGHSGWWFLFALLLLAGGGDEA